LSKIKKNQLVKALGYEFADEALLQRALSHRSVGKDNNERLEFLGDSLLNFIIADLLCQKFPEAPEGDLSRLRASLVKGETLADIARSFELGEYLNLGEGEMKSGGFRRASILADTVEALLGAIYLEAGLEQCQSRIQAWFSEQLESVSPNATQKDAKTQLQEHLQEQRKPLPKYSVIRQLGESHSPAFEVSCRVGDSDSETSAIAGSKRQAEKLAAEKMLQKLGVAR